MLNIQIISFHACPYANLGDRYSGGMNVYVLQTARELAARGNQVDIFTRSHDTNDPKVVNLEDKLRIIHIDAGPYECPKNDLPNHIPEFTRGIERISIVNNLVYDVIHSHYWLSAIAGKSLSFEYNIPHIVTFHTLAKSKNRARAGEDESEQRIKIEKQSIDSADAVVVSTSDEQQDISVLYSKSLETISVINAGVDPELFKPSSQRNARNNLGITEENVVLYVGRIEPLKGVDILLKAFSLMENISETRLMIVGGNVNQSSEISKLRLLSSKLSIDEQVTFTGAVEHRELPIYYNATDVFALPSYYESFGLVALEAMACGKPVVASRVGGLKSLVKDGVSGYLIPWRCAEPFANKLDILLKNNSLNKKMGEAAREAAIQLSWSSTADSLSDLYNDFISPQSLRFTDSGTGNCENSKVKSS